jgi:glycerol-3-phosphate dehydrogenase
MRRRAGIRSPCWSKASKGTSSRSTKLIHGGVRYLQQGNISLVREALRERGLLARNAPHLVRSLPLVVPAYRWWERSYYGLGMWVYDRLAGKLGIGRSQRLSREQTLDRVPTLAAKGLRGGVLYYDGQFDDARLLINLVQTAVEQGAAVLNYAPVVRLSKDAAGKATGVVFRDDERGDEHDVRARVVINASGPFVDGVRRLDEPQAAPMIDPSQGIHLVFDQRFLPGDTAILVPRTRDGRVLFVIPWNGAVLAGTTDTPISEAALEPRPLEEEVEFVLQTMGDYLETKPTRADIRSMFAGIRPLVRRGGAKNTAALSRDHTLVVSSSGMLTITGGKWTTYRHMAEDCVNRAAQLAGLPARTCATENLPVHGACSDAEVSGTRTYYGSDAQAVESLARNDPAMAAGLHDDLPYTAADVVWAVQHEIARTVDDVLARRTRALLLNAKAAIDSAPAVAKIMAQQLGRDAAWEKEQVRTFRELAAGYVAR